MGTPDKLVALGKRFADLKARKDDLEDKLKIVEGELKQIATVDLPTLMEDNECPKFSISGIGTIFLNQEIYASVLKDDRPRLYEWLRETGQGDLVEDWVFPGRLTAFAKEQLNEGKQLPDFVKATFIPTARLRKS